MTVRAIKEMIQTPGSTPQLPEMLVIQDLHFAFGDRTVLNGLSLAVKSGETFGMLGPNGSGKSTALAILAGLLKASSGTVGIGEKGGKPGDTAVRAMSGVVFQHPSLDDKLTARHNLELAASLHGLKHDGLAGQIDQALERAGLLDRQSESVGTFSGGMKRKLDIARALLPGPSLLLMDEPTSGLDEAAFRSTWEHLEGLREEMNLTVVVATHRPEEAERCDRLAVLHEGVAKIVDSPMGLKQRVSSDVVELVGTNPMKLVEEIAASFPLEPRIDGNAVTLECEKGHDLIPRLVESLPNGRLQSIRLRQPSLADVFLKVTGQQLDGEGIHAMTTGDEE